MARHYLLKFNKNIMDKNISKILFLTALMLIGVSRFAIAQEQASVQIIPGKDAAHIAYINGDTLAVITGTTYQYTVDTPEGKGLVSTNAGAAQLLSELTSKNGSVQKYSITDWATNLIMLNRRFLN